MAADRGRRVRAPARRLRRRHGSDDPRARSTARGVATDQSCARKDISRQTWMQFTNSALPEKGVWCESTAFRHSCARSSKRAGGLIPRIALDQCRVPERYRTRLPFELLNAK